MGHIIGGGMVKKGAAFALPTADLLQHLDAAAITGLDDDDAVATWVATVGTDGTQSTEAERPLYKTNIQNGLPIVRSDGTDDNLSLSGLSTVSDEHTHIMVVKPTSGGNLLSAQVGPFVVSPNFGAWIQYFDGSWHSVGVLATSVFQILSFVLSDTGGEVFRNGVSLGTSTWAGSPIGSSNVALFANAWGSGAFLGCDLAEYLVYDTALSEAARQQAETYLNSKWNIY